MRHALALHAAPIALRIGLGITFLWAGTAKITQQMTPTPTQQAKLLAWGIGNPPETQPETPPQSPQPAEATPQTAPVPSNTPPAQPPTDTPAPDPAPPAQQPIDAPAPQSETPPDPQPENQPQALTVSFAADPQPVRRVMDLALLIDSAANPGPDEYGTPQTQLLPDAVAKGKWPVYLAWTAAVVELVAGAAVLLGFFTRLACLPLAATMAAAIWLTQIGPAIQTGTTLLGVLPSGIFDLQPDHDYAYTQLLWQLALLLMALALFLTGPGALSIDRVLFGPIAQPGPDRHDDEPVELVPIRPTEPRPARTT